MNITVLGAGAWGTSLALLLDQNRHQVRIWGHNAEHLAEIARERTHDRALPNILIPAGLSFEPDLNLALEGAHAVVLAVPSRALRAIATRMATFRGPVISVTKGIEAETGLTMCSVLQQAIPGAIPAALSGPSLALEVARGIPTAVVAAAEEPATARLVQPASPDAPDIRHWNGRGGRGDRVVIRRGQQPTRQGVENRGCSIVQQLARELRAATLAAAGPLRDAARGAAKRRGERHG
jgi:predicted dinucleotide-binding enzyme